MPNMTRGQLERVARRVQEAREAARERVNNLGRVRVDAAALAQIGQQYCGLHCTVMHKAGALDTIGAEGREDRAIH